MHLVLGFQHPHFKFLWKLNMMTWGTSKVKQGLIWGCDSSPPLNKNLVPRFKTWGKKTEGHKPTRYSWSNCSSRRCWSVASINVDVFAFEIFIRHDDDKGNSIEIVLLKDRATHDQLTECDVEYLLSWDSTHTSREGWSETENEDSSW